MFWLLPALVLLAGCQCFERCVAYCIGEAQFPPVTYSGTFTGRAEKGELFSEEGEAFAVTVLRVETRSRLKKHGGGFEWLEPWDADKPKKNWKIMILSDRCAKAYPPDQYAGKRLKVTGEVDEHYGLWPFPGGPELSVPLGRKVDSELSRAWILYVDSIEVVDSGATTAVVKTLPVAGRASLQWYKGWRGRIERCELHSPDGTVFPVAAFKIEGVPRIDKPEIKSLLIKSPTAILVDACYTAYPLDRHSFLNRYGGTNLTLSGGIQEGTAFAFPGGPKLMRSAPSGADIGPDRYPVLVVEYRDFPH